MYPNQEVAQSALARVRAAVQLSLSTPAGASRACNCRSKIFRTFLERYRNWRRLSVLRLNSLAGLLNYELAHAQRFMQELQ